MPQPAHLISAVIVLGLASPAFVDEADWQEVAKGLGVSGSVEPGDVYKVSLPRSDLEPPGAAHSVSENASATEPARLLAVFVAEDGAELTTLDR